MSLNLVKSVSQLCSSKVSSYEIILELSVVVIIYIKLDITNEKKPTPPNIMKIVRIFSLFDMG